MPPGGMPVGMPGFGAAPQPAPGPSFKPDRAAMVPPLYLPISPSTPLYLHRSPHISLHLREQVGGDSISPYISIELPYISLDHRSPLYLP